MCTVLYYCHWVSTQLQLTNISIFNILCAFVLRNNPQWVTASSFTRFPDHTRHTTVGSTPLDDRSTHLSDLYLTTHNTHDRHASGEIGTHKLGRRVASDLRLRPRGHRDRHYVPPAVTATMHGVDSCRIFSNTSTNLVLTFTILPQEGNVYITSLMHS